jgi:hypothetical protein
MDFMPPSARFLIEDVLVPHVFPLFGMAHTVEAGAKRLVDGLFADGYKSGAFYASKTKVTGPVVDQATLYPELGDVKLQDNAAAAVQRFVKSGSVPATQATANQVAA